ncbi:hypothetical protein KCP69_21970 [Salmonella enterica subsp. enterica]|nr:hypothetical protein KCP69_21970 [Salmonella enterica subsp. enterica]
MPSGMPTDRQRKCTDNVNPVRQGETRGHVLEGRGALMDQHHWIKPARCAPRRRGERRRHSCWCRQHWSPSLAG